MGADAVGGPLGRPPEPEVELLEIKLGLEIELDPKFKVELGIKLDLES